MQKERPIGIFDSGIGGLTVQREIASLLPGEDTIYLGDTAHLPYGTKSKEAVTRFSHRIAEFLVGHDIKLLVVACNTASAFCLDALTESLDIPVIGVIRPGARAAVEGTVSSRIGVVGTEGTIKSRAYEEAIKEIDPSLEVFSKACPLFVPLAEEGLIDNSVARLTAELYLSAFDDKQIDTLVLGCTHYPLLKSVIKDALDSTVMLIDSAEATAIEVKRLLTERSLLSMSEESKASHRFYVTDSPERFISVGKNFLGSEFKSAELVDLDQ